MKLGYNTKAKDPTYYIQLGIRNGKKTTTKNIATIGKHSELLAITDDPLAYAKAQVAKYNEAMEEKNQVSMEVLLDFSEKVKSSEKVVSESTRKAVGYFYLAHLYRKLEIQQFFQEKTKDRKFTFSPELVNRFLTYARILDPDSKLGSLEKMNHFFEEPDFDYQHILRTMDLMAENYDDYIAYLFHASNKVVKRNTAVCYYDCTNYYCEAESAGRRLHGPDYRRSFNRFKTIWPCKRSQAKSSGRNGTVHGYERDSDFDVYHTRKRQRTDHRASLGKRTDSHVR